MMTCSRCGGVSARFEPFTSLILPLGEERRGGRPLALADLIQELFKPEEIHGIDCDYCRRKQLFNRTLDVWKLPPFLVLTLSRFSFDSRSAQKVTSFVEYPVSDSLSLEALIGAEAPLQEFSDYELYAVIEHEGSVNRGHYTAMLKANGTWLSANDARVTTISEANVLTRNAYMLFYRWRAIGDPDSMFDVDEYLH